MAKNYINNLRLWEMENKAKTNPIKPNFKRHTLEGRAIV
jgi:hypothetical protein